MIKFVDGDLLQATEDIIGHQVNCRRKMRSGIAKQIREKYPRAYDVYMASTEGYDPEDLLGKIALCPVGGKIIAHLFGQLNYGYDGQRYTSYDGLYDSLVKLKDIAKRHSKSVALPANLGSDRGGADWDIVLKMIEKVFDDYEVTIYTYNK